MGIYIGCIFENNFHKRNDKEASKAFLRKAIDILKEHYSLDDDAFMLNMDNENDIYEIETDSLEDISRISLCDGIWCVELSQKYDILFFSDLYYFEMIKELAVTLGAREMWICDDMQIWRGNFCIYNRCLSEWLEYLKSNGIEYMEEFPIREKLLEYEHDGVSKYPYNVVYHVGLI